MASDENHEEYTNDLIAFLETVWGEGYLSPGGGEEVDRVLEGISLAGKKVLDIGCGAGGITMRLAATHQAGHVTGIDVEAPVLNVARKRLAENKDLAARVVFQ